MGACRTGLSGLWPLLGTVPGAGEVYPGRVWTRVSALAAHGMRGQLDERLLSGGAGSGAAGDQALAGLGDVQDLALQLQRPAWSRAGRADGMPPPARPSWLSA